MLIGWLTAAETEAGNKKPISEPDYLVQRRVFAIALDVLALFLGNSTLALRLSYRLSNRGEVLAPSRDRW